MSILLYFILVYFSILLTYLIVLIFLISTLKIDNSADSFIEQPYISILIAARNEEENILACLESIEKIEWPNEKFEVLVGNDQSSDRTAQIVLEFIKDKNNYRLITIDRTHGLAKGKANVLAVLAKEAKGSLFFITDADIRVPKKWIQSLLANYNEKIGIVSGATITKGTSVFHDCQSLDWVYGFGMIKVVSDYSIPVSAVGNNMMISRVAYESTGGYEKIPFSVTEDFQLFIETLKRGWSYKNLMSTDSLAVSEPIQTFFKLLIQRKRWMKGAVRVPLILLCFLFLQALFLPLLIITLCYFPILGFSFWLIKIGLKQIFIFYSYKRINEKFPFFKSVFVFEIYSAALSFIVLIVYFIPTKVKWKGREY